MNKTQQEPEVGHENMQNPSMAQLKIDNWRLHEKIDELERERDRLVAALKALVHKIPNGEHLADMVQELEEVEAAIAEVEK